MNGAKVLIIDDDVEICLNMKDMFGYENIGADYARTAKEAFQKMEHDGHKLILVDIKLEGRVSGVDIIKSFRDKQNRPKIIVISAVSLDLLDPIFQREEIVHLIDGYLDKPSCSNPDKLMSMAKLMLLGNEKE